MKRFLLFFLTNIVALSAVRSTEQISDKLIIGNEVIYLQSFPFEYLRIKESPFTYGNYGFPNTGCYRGYIATWKIEDSKLLLVEIRKLDSIGTKLNIVDYLEKNNYKPTIVNGFVFADWYTDSLKRYAFFTYYANPEDFYIARDYLRKKNKKVELIFEKGVLIENNIIPIKNYQIGDTLYYDVRYYLNWWSSEKTARVEGVIIKCFGREVLLKIESFGTTRKRVIKRIKETINLKADNLFINPRYWEKKTTHNNPLVCGQRCP